MTVHRSFAYLVAIFACALGGCEVLESLAGGVERPSASVERVQLRELSLTSATLVFDVDVSNPYAVALPLTNLEYALASDGQAFLSGTADVQGTVPAKGSRLVEVPATVQFAEVIAILSGVRPGAVVPYTADFKLGVEAPAVGQLELPLRKEGALPVPAVPSVELGGIRWEKLSFSSADAVLDVKVKNTNDFPVDLRTLSYDLALGDVRVVAGSLDAASTLSAGGNESLPIKVSFSPANLGLAAFNMLAGNGASYKLGGTLECKTPYGPLDLRYGTEGKTEFSK